MTGYRDSKKPRIVLEKDGSPDRMPMRMSPGLFLQHKDNYCNEPEDKYAFMVQGLDETGVG